VTDALKLTTYFGERDRAGDRFLADALADLYAHHQLRTSLVLRGVAGFGVKHHLHTDRLLTLSEDLPMVSVAVDARARIEAVVDEVVALSGDGLITLERARMADAAVVAAVGEEVKLTVHLGRGERADGRPAHIAVVDALHRHGVAGATVLLGVDGTARGERRRARFFAANTRVPLMVMAVGAGERIADAVAELRALPAEPLMTLERVRVCKRDGRLLADPGHVPETDDAGLGIWQKLTIHSAEDARHDGHALHLRLVRRLREERATGATALRGIWGFSGGREPHGDRFLAMRRGVPVLTVLVDRPEAIRRLWPIVDEVTDRAGLVTSELVPAFRAVGPGIESGGLRLADPRG
jgi:PII-like signaling protein